MVAEKLSMCVWRGGGDSALLKDRYMADVGGGRRVGGDMK